MSELNRLLALQLATYLLVCIFDSNNAIRMYLPSANPSLVQEDQGVWAPVDHQRVISKLTVGLVVLFYRDKTIALEPLPETMLDEGKASLVPDISLRDNNTALTPIIVEICHTNGLRGDLRKVIQLIDDDLYGIRKGFIYDYRTNSWLRYQFGDGGLTTTSSYSTLLNLDLSDFLR